MSPARHVLTPSESLTLRGLVGRYVAAPDPIDWLACADFWEERGEDALALSWRRRAEWFPRLRGWVGEMADAASQMRDVKPLRGVPFRCIELEVAQDYSWGRGGSLVKVEVWTPPDGRGHRLRLLHWSVPAVRRECDDAGAKRHRNRRVIDLVDRLHALCDRIEGDGKA